MGNLYQYHNNLSQLSVEINLRKDSIIVPSFVPTDLVDIYQVCRVLDEYLIEHFNQTQKQPSTIDIYRDMDDILERFKQEVLTSLFKQKEEFRQSNNSQKTKFQNIFEFAECENLYLSNKYVNLISENLGHKLEEIANLSNQVLIPEKNLKIKIKGIDLIIFDQGMIRYTQLKTKKDTLTGSQQGRSINELKIHKNSIFAAALDMGNSWTISYKKSQEYGIEIMTGERFWSSIGLDYNLILSKLAAVIKKSIANFIDLLKFCI
jgi:hypothetical protein